MRPTFYHAAPGSLALAGIPATDTMPGEAPSSLQDDAGGWGAYIIFPDKANARRWARQHAPESRTVEMHRLRLSKDTRFCRPFERDEDLSAMLRVLGLRGAFAMRDGLKEREFKKLSTGLPRLGYDALLAPHYAIVFNPDVIEVLGYELTT